MLVSGSFRSRANVDSSSSGLSEAVVDEGESQNCENGDGGAVGIAYHLYLSPEKLLSTSETGSGTSAQGDDEQCDGKLLGSISADHTGHQDPRGENMERVPFQHYCPFPNVVASFADTDALLVSSSRNSN